MVTFGLLSLPQVVGHTIQRSGINSTCDGRVHRIDVGLSRGCGDGTPQVLPSSTHCGHASCMACLVAMHARDYQHVLLWLRHCQSD